MSHPATVAIQDFPDAWGGGVPTPTYYLAKFTEKCMKVKARLWFPLDPLISRFLLQKRVKIYLWLSQVVKRKQTKVQMGVPSNLVL